MLKLRYKDTKQNAVWLLEPAVRIGTGSQNEMVLEDTEVGETHANILVEHEKLVLENCSKGLPVYVNGQSVKDRIALVANDILLLGSTQLQVEDPKIARSAKPQAKVASTASPLSAWALKSNHSALNNKVFTLGAETLVGRSKDCDITLAAAHLSRQHARLTIENDRLHVKDLDSSNGTFVNGRRVTEARVSRGDELRFDSLAFGVIGPADDLDKTTIRPVVSVKSAVKPKPVTRVKRSAAPAVATVKPSATPYVSPELKDQSKRGPWLSVFTLILLGGVGAYFYLGAPF